MQPRKLGRISTMRLVKINFDEVSGLSSMQLRIILIMNTFAMTGDGFKQDGITTKYGLCWLISIYVAILQSVRK